MTRPAPHPICTCAHCHQRIIPTGRTWSHDMRRDARADECIVQSQYTGTVATPQPDPLLTETTGWVRCCDCNEEIPRGEPCVDLRNNKGDICCVACGSDRGVI